MHNSLVDHFLKQVTLNKRIHCLNSPSVSYGSLASVYDIYYLGGSLEGGKWACVRNAGLNLWSQSGSVYPPLVHSLI